MDRLASPKWFSGHGGCWLHVQEGMWRALRKDSPHARDGEHAVIEGFLCSQQIQPPLALFMPLSHVPLVWLVASLLVLGFGCSV